MTRLPRLRLSPHVKLAVGVSIFIHLIVAFFDLLVRMQSSDNRAVSCMCRVVHLCKSFIVTTVSTHDHPHVHVHVHVVHVVHVHVHTCCTCGDHGLVPFFVTLYRLFCVSKHESPCSCIQYPEGRGAHTHSHRHSSDMSDDDPRHTCPGPCLAAPRPNWNLDTGYHSTMSFRGRPQTAALPVQSLPPAIRRCPSAASKRGTVSARASLPLRALRPQTARATLPTTGPPRAR